MQVALLANGKRDLRDRPYINGEELALYIGLYNPNEPIHYGLYDHQQCLCPWWQNYAQNAFATGFASESGYIAPNGQVKSFVRPQQWSSPAVPRETPVARPPSQMQRRQEAYRSTRR